jgi:hypothetical protein
MYVGKAWQRRLKRWRGGTREVAQIVECLLSKCEALSSNSSAAKKENKAWSGLNHESFEC